MVLLPTQLRLEIDKKYHICTIFFRSAGGLLIYSFGYFFTSSQIAFPMIFLPLLSLILCYFLCPESPIFLIKSLKSAEALEVIQNLDSKQSKDEIRSKIRDINNRLNNHQESNGILSCLTNAQKTLKRPEVWKPFLILMSLNFVQQFASLAIFRTYIIDIFDDIFMEKNETFIGNGTNFANNSTNHNAGIMKPVHCRGEYQAYITAVILGIVKTSFSFVTPIFVDHHRRRRIYFNSGIKE